MSDYPLYKFREIHDFFGMKSPKSYDFLGKIQYFYLFLPFFLCFSKDKCYPPTTLKSYYSNAFRYSFSILLQIPSNGIFSLDG